MNINSNSNFRFKNKTLLKQLSLAILDRTTRCGKTALPPSWRFRLSDDSR